MVTAPIPDDNSSEMGWQQECRFSIQISDIFSLGIVMLNGHEMLTNVVSESVVVDGMVVVVEVLVVNVSVVVDGGIIDWG